METKKKIVITVHGEIDSKELYDKLSGLSMNVTDLGSLVYIYGVVDLAESIIERIIKICYSYGPCDVKLSSIAD